MVKRLMALQASSILIGVIAIISFISINSINEAFNWINHTHSVIYQLHRVKDDITDCQTSIRETIFSNNKNYINIYMAKQPGIESELDNLQWLTRDNEIQQKNVYDLRKNSERRLQGWRETLDLFNDNKIQEAQYQMKEKFGESWMSTTRNIVEIIESEEQRLLELRLKDYKQKTSIALYGIPLLMIIYVVIFNTATKSIGRKIEKSYADRPVPE